MRQTHLRWQYAQRLRTQKALDANFFKTTIVLMEKLYLHELEDEEIEDKDEEDDDEDDESDDIKRKKEAGDEEDDKENKEDEELLDS